MQIDIFFISTKKYVALIYLQIRLQIHRSYLNTSEMLQEIMEKIGRIPAALIDRHLNT